ncbi:MAG: TetR/AcrR family transcriptional regulator [Polyangiaceae bacterium]
MSKRHESNAARKGPQQQRSKATVGAILDATVRVLEQEGSDAATTSRIAEVAGVSVGTLYQYFANRDAILDALQDREFERASEMMSRILARGAYATDREVAHAVIGGLLELHGAAPTLHRLLVVEGLRVTPTERVQAFDMRIIALVRSFLSLANVRIRRKNLDAAAFVVYQAVRASMLACLLERPPGLDSETLVDEITDLVLRYLAADPAPLSQP